MPAVLARHERRASEHDAVASWRITTQTQLVPSRPAFFSVKLSRRAGYFIGLSAICILLSPFDGRTFTHIHARRRPQVFPTCRRRFIITIRLALVRLSRRTRLYRRSAKPGHRHSFVLTLVVSLSDRNRTYRRETELSTNVVVILESYF